MLVLLMIHVNYMQYYDVKVKVLATVTKSKPIVLGAWDFF